VANISTTEARKRLYALIDEVGDSHQLVQITGKRGNAVLLSEAAWNAILETLHLVSIRGCANRSLMAWPHRQKSSAISPAGELERSPDSRLRRSCP
jgi:PHD/YefM family antitoxin component YafN of YafNO toxin-antitoxin module